MFFRISSPVFSWICVLLLLTMRSYEVPKWELGGLNGYSIIQFLLFLGFSHLLICAFKKQLKFERLREKAVPLTVIVGIALAVLLEFSRWFFGFTVYFHNWNMGFNILGIFTGIGSFRLVYGNIH